MTLISCTCSRSLTELCSELGFEHAKPYALLLKESAGPSLGQRWNAAHYQPLWT